MAETEQATAEKQQMYAETAQGNAMTAAAGEIKIVEKTKTVADTSITIDEMTHSSEINDVKNITGLLTSEKIMTMSDPVDSTPNDPATDDVDEALGGAEARELDIGFTYDSADDSARVTLVHSYAGTKAATVFLDGTGGGTPPSSTKPGMVDNIDHDGDTDELDATPNISLPLTKASGTFMAVEDGLAGIIATTTTPTDIYYYETSTGKTYVRSNGSVVADNVTTYNYTIVNIRAGAKTTRRHDVLASPLRRLVRSERQGRWEQHRCGSRARLRRQHR